MNQKLTRRSPLVDLALRNTSTNRLYEYFPVKKLREALPRARRFVFDEKSSAYMGRFVRDCGDMIINNRQFAIPPFDPCIIEFDIDVMLKELGKTTSGQNPQFQHGKEDSRIAYFFVGNQIFEVATADDGNLPMFTPMAISVNTPANQTQIFSTDKHREEYTRLAVLLGTTFHQIDDETSSREILNNTRFHFFVPSSVQPKLLEVISGMTGYLRNAIVALLLLNQKKGVTFEHIPHEVNLVKGKRTVYAAHSVVKIDLTEPSKHRTYVPGAERTSPRRHDVRGHFSHKGLQEDCIHSWPLMPNERGHWICENCKGIRWWRDAFTRGDSEKGFVTKTYDVGANKS